MKHEKITLKVTGMHCASCAVNIESHLKKQKGVKSVSVNYASEKALVNIDSKQVNLDKLQSEIKSLGYDSQEFSYHDHADGSVGMQKKIIIYSLTFSLPLFYISMGEMLGLPQVPITSFQNTILQLILATIVLFINSRVFISGVKRLIKRSPDMDSLVAIGTLSAYVYSLFNIGRGHLFFESAAFILVFISLGKYLEGITKGKTSESIKRLIGLQPKTAIVIRGKREEEISISEVVVGDVVVIKPGERLPVDGIVIDGDSTIDESMITGESIPVEKIKGSKVIGATINKTGSLKIKATKVGADTMLSQIVKTVEEAMNSKAPIQLLADKVSYYFVPTVILTASITLIVWLLLGQPFSFALTAFVSVLIIACPCALGLATPTAVMMGTGLAAKSGILIKTSKALEAAGKIEVVVFDKTGTLTVGKPKVVDVVSFEKQKSSQETVLQIAASLEKTSEHPLAQAIVESAKEEKIKLHKVESFKAIPGKGVIGMLGGKEVILGTRKLIKARDIDLSIAEGDIKKFENQGKTCVIVVVDNQVLGLIAIADTLKKKSKETVDYLHKLGKEVAMITGDNQEVARAISKEVGIDYVLAEVLPKDKAKEVKKLQKGGRVVVMVGDGINDAPALAQADLGIALGSGTDIAIETGEIVLIKNDLRDVIRAIDVSRYTMTKIKQNLFWAFFYNVVGIPIAAGVLYPSTGWLLSPVMAAIAMSFSSVSVVSNALLMKRYRTKI